MFENDLWIYSKVKGQAFPHFRVFPLSLGFPLILTSCFLSYLTVLPLITDSSRAASRLPYLSVSPQYECSVSAFSH